MYYLLGSQPLKPLVCVCQPQPLSSFQWKGHFPNRQSSLPCPNHRCRSKLSTFPFTLSIKLDGNLLQSRQRISTIAPTQRPDTLYLKSSIQSIRAGNTSFPFTWID